MPTLRVARSDDEAALRRPGRGLPMQQFRRGDMFAALLAAANCDRAKFENAHTFDIRRHPNPHLSFGTGVHFCLGFQLARAEAEIAFERILVRFPDMRLRTNSDPIAWHK